MKKIVVTSDMGFTEEQKSRLDRLGEVTYFDEPLRDADAWLERVKGAEIIVTEQFGLKENLNNLQNVFVSYPFVALEGIDKEKLRQKNIVLANSPGCNKNAVCEWVAAMMINLSRKFKKYLNHEKNIPLINIGLKNKKVTILGKGNIGSKIGKICEAFDMKVCYFIRNDDLEGKCKDADVVINCLSQNESTNHLLDHNFFMSLKPGSFFISCSSQTTYDVEAMIEALNKGILMGVADDCWNGHVGDTKYEYYKKISQYPKILATPHIAWATDVSISEGNEIAIQNVEAWFRGESINIVS